MENKYLFLRSPGLMATFFLLLLSAFSVNAQEVFNISNPAGQYVITDYMGKKITLNIGKATSTDMFGMPKGTGTITINGRTLKGNWDVTECLDDDYFLVFETYDNVKMTYYLPKGSTRIDQIIISQDGRVSYSISELYNTIDADWVKAKRVTSSKKKTGSTKKTSTKKKSRK